MTPMDPQDARINLQVKAVLVSRYIDTSKVDFFTTHGTVYLRGPLRQMKGTRNILNSEIDNIIDNISRISGVKGIVNDLAVKEISKAEKKLADADAEAESKAACEQE